VTPGGHPPATSIWLARPGTKPTSTVFRRALVEHDSTFSRHLATGSLPASRARRTVIRSLALALALPLPLTLTLTLTLASRARRTVIRSLALALPLPLTLTLTLTLTLASRARRTVTEARSSPRQRRRGWALEAGGWRLEALSP
jgi:hypothetical protein